MRALIQTAVFSCLVGGYCLFNAFRKFSSDAKEDVAAASTTTRVMQQSPSSNPCEGLKVANPGWLATFFGIGVVYMFLALAIVCDEFFVPALEEMASPRRLNLSNDVAGATLMAAGGSAPELFTALFGTFQASAIGYGTIVGSAVFNVLFVIAICSFLTKEVLTLTWWPLFRDSLYYAIGLVMLAIFSGVVSPKEVQLWEAVVLFVMYLGYIVIMWQNANIYKLLTGKVLDCPSEDESSKNGADDNNEKEEHIPEAHAGSALGDRPSINKIGSKGSVISTLSARELAAKTSHPHFRWQGTFRAGILKLLRDPESWVDAAGVGIVSKIAGDADYVFQQVDIDGNGQVDREELKQLFNLLECYVSSEELEEVFNQLDEDKDGTVRSDSEFSNSFLSRLIIFIACVFAALRLAKRNLQTGIADQKKEFFLKFGMSSIKLMSINPTPLTRLN